MAPKSSVPAVSHVTLGGKNLPWHPGPRQGCRTSQDEPPRPAENAVAFSRPFFYNNYLQNNNFSVKITVKNKHTKIQNHIQSLLSNQTSEEYI